MPAEPLCAACGGLSGFYYHFDFLCEDCIMRELDGIRSTKSKHEIAFEAAKAFIKIVDPYRNGLRQPPQTMAEADAWLEAHAL